MININFDSLNEKIDNINVIKYRGVVTEVTGLAIYVKGIKASIGEICNICKDDKEEILCEVIGFKDNNTTLMALEDTSGIYPGCKVESVGKLLTVGCSDALLGGILDGLGRRIDNKAENYIKHEYKLNNNPPNPLERKNISKKIQTGIRAIDSFITCGEGQRIGIFSGSGVGKSTMLGMIARNAESDVNVIALIGERGRELNEFIEKDLGKEGMKKTIIVCSTSDQSPLIRVKGALTATAIAEYFRDQGKKVILMMDSVTRFAMAQREIGLTAGEPPTQKGYTPSVFSILPKLMERTGLSEKGSITAFYTVLVDGDDFNEPISDTVRGILDGHIVLSRKLAHKNHYPAIDILSSLSRVMNSIVSQEHKNLANKARDYLAIYKENEDIISIGAYQEGTNKKLDLAIKYQDEINKFLRQSIDDYNTSESTLEILKKILN